MQNVSRKCLQNERRTGNLLEMKRLVIQTSITSTFVDQRSSPGKIKELVNGVEAWRVLPGFPRNTSCSRSSPFSWCSWLGIFTSWCGKKLRFMNPSRELIHWFMVPSDLWIMFGAILSHKSSKEGSLSMLMLGFIKGCFHWGTLERRCPTLRHPGFH